MTKILVIEDTHSLALDLVEIFQWEGYEAAYALDGVAGLEKALEFQPDVVILDYHLPTMAGIEVCERLQEVETTCHAHIIMQTGYTEVGMRLKALRAGATAFLPKPFDIGELLQLVIEITTRPTQRQSGLGWLDSLYNQTDLSAWLPIADVGAMVGLAIAHFNGRISATTPAQQAFWQGIIERLSNRPLAEQAEGLKAFLPLARALNAAPEVQTAQVQELAKAAYPHEVRLMAIQSLALNRLGLDTLLHLAHDPIAQIRSAVLEALQVFMDDERVMGCLKARVEDEQAEEVLLALLKVVHGLKLVELVQQLRQHANPKVQKAAKAIIVT